MPRLSPTLEGFRAAFRRPSFALAEIIWRWVFGATAIALFFFGLFEFLDTLPVTRGEMLFLKTRQPYLVLQAILHILRGGFRRAVISAIIAALLLMLVWILAGSFGRIATVRALVDYFRMRVAGRNTDGPGQADSERGEGGGAGSLQSLIWLNFLRVAVAVAAAFGFFGAGILSSLVSPSKHPHPLLAFLLFFPVAGLVGLMWWVLNWLLSLAAMFAVRDHDHALDAILAAFELLRRRTGAVLAVNTWVGLAHLVAFVGATTVVSIPLGFVPVVPWRIAVLAMIVITLAYFAVADWLYLARMAGYVCIAEMPDEMFAPLPPPPAPYIPVPLQTTIDRDELILSDVPGLSPTLAVET